MARVLIACEFSGTVRDAFARAEKAEAKLAEYEKLADDLSAWDKRWPITRIYSGTSFKKHEDELAALIKRAEELRK